MSTMQPEGSSYTCAPKEATGPADDTFRLPPKSSVPWLSSRAVTRLENWHPRMIAAGPLYWFAALLLATSTLLVVMFVLSPFDANGGIAIAENKTFGGLYVPLLLGASLCIGVKKGLDVGWRFYAGWLYSANSANRETPYEWISTMVPAYQPSVITLIIRGWQFFHRGPNNVNARGHRWKSIEVFLWYGPVGTLLACAFVLGLVVSIQTVKVNEFGLISVDMDLTCNVGPNADCNPWLQNAFQTDFLARVGQILTHGEDPSVANLDRSDYADHRYVLPAWARSKVNGPPSEEVIVQARRSDGVQLPAFGVTATCGSEHDIEYDSSQSWLTDDLITIVNGTAIDLATSLSTANISSGWIWETKSIRQRKFSQQRSIVYGNLFEVTSSTQCNSGSASPIGISNGFVACPKSKSNMTVCVLEVARGAMDEFIANHSVSGYRSLSQYGGPRPAFDQFIHEHTSTFDGRILLPTCDGGRYTQACFTPGLDPPDAEEVMGDLMRSIGISGVRARWSVVTGEELKIDRQTTRQAPVIKAGPVALAAVIVGIVLILTALLGILASKEPMQIANHTISVEWLMRYDLRHTANTNESSYAEDRQSSIA